jgi:hypothetical protein
MRTMVCALVGALLLAAAPAAMAAPPDAALDFKYSSKKPGTSSGFTFAVAIDASSGAVPNQTGIVLTFANGSKLDVDGAQLCTNPGTPEERDRDGHAAHCEADSKIGEGVANAIVGGNDVRADLSFWNIKSDKGGFMNMDSVISNGVRLPYFSGKVGTRQIDFNYCCPQPISEIGMEIDKNTVDGVNYLTTPPKCPRSGKWKVGATIKYEDGTKQKLTDTTPCKAPKKRK